jgi:hypothetical protein
MNVPSPNTLLKNICLSIRIRNLPIRGIITRWSSRVVHAITQFHLLKEAGIPYKPARLHRDAPTLALTAQKKEFLIFLILCPDRYRRRQQISPRFRAKKEPNRNVQRNSDNSILHPTSFVRVLRWQVGWNCPTVKRPEWLNRPSGPSHKPSILNTDR